MRSTLLRGRSLPRLTFEPLEPRRLLAQYEFMVNLYEDAGGVPGDLIAADTVSAGDSFFAEITADDLRSDPQGLRSMGVHVGWDPAVFEEIDAPFDPSDPRSPLVTDNFPLYRAGELDAADGVIYNLCGGASLAFGAGRPIGIDGPERFALLRFRALQAAADSPLVVQASGSVGFIPMRFYTPSDLRFESQTITVLERCEPSLADSVSTIDPTETIDPTIPTGPTDAEDPTTVEQADHVALVGLQVNLYEDAHGAPGDPIADDTLEVGDAFFAEITAEDLRDLPQGIGGLSVDVSWNPDVFQEIDQPFDPSDQNTALVTDDLPLYRSGSLDNTTGQIDELGGASFRSTGSGAPIGTDGPQRFSLLHFRATGVADDSPFSLSIGDGGVGVVGSLVTAPADVRIESQSITVVESQAPPEIAIATFGPEAGVIQFTTAVGGDGGDPLVSPLVRPAYPDTKQYLDITNPGTSALTIYEIQIHAPDVTIDMPLTADANDDLILAAGQSRRFHLTYAPSSPNPLDASTQSFDVPDGLVILSNAESTPRIEVSLSGESTYDADITYDGRVNMADLTVFDDHFGLRAGEPGYHLAIDPNGDGVVDLGDFGPLNAYYLASRPSPEPTLLPQEAPATISSAADAVFAAAGPEDVAPLPASDGMEDALSAVAAGWFDSGADNDQEMLPPAVLDPLAFA